jgi:hypothetical protein
MSVVSSTGTTWRVRGSYFEACNCDAICPCRSVHMEPGGPSTYGVCYGSLSWHVLDGHAGDVNLDDRKVVISLRYHDDVRPTTRWEVICYVDERADDAQFAALSDIFLGRAGGTVSRLYGRAIGTVHDVKRARIRVEHVAARKRIDVVGYLLVEGEQPASEPGDVRCGVPGYDHPGTELFGEVLESHDGPFEWAIVGKRNGSFASDFEYRSDDGG